MTHDEAFLQAIIDDPADDTPRLIYADWLDENAWRVADGKARKGTTSAGDEAAAHGDESTVRARAEFIRIQCELACHCLPLSPAVNGVRSAPLCLACVRETQRPDEHTGVRRRERELFLRHCHEWMPPTLEELRLVPALSGGGANFRRGFVAEISLTCADFAGGVCPACGGNGSVPDPELTATVDAHNRYIGCSHCHGTGRTPGVAGALFAAAPIEKVTLTDREASGYSQEDWRWILATEPIRTGDRHYRSYQDWIPERLARLLNPPRWEINHACYDSPATAHEDLSAACVKHGREQRKKLLASQPRS